ncbi:MAG: hypothetical protein LBK06_00615 [Planctomycetaceae bacterium]|nr:hypothetical protein [Planctomycetaceae bacterium]
MISELITRDDISRFCKLNGVEEVELFIDRIDDNGNTSLNLAGCNVIRLGLVDKSRQLNDRDIYAISSNVKRLSSFKIRGGQFSCKAIGSLSRLNNLHDLVIDTQGISENELQTEKTNFDNLKTLTIITLTSLEKGSLDFIKNMPNIESVRIISQSTISADSLSFLGNAVSLKYLTIRSVKTELPPIGLLVNLKKLDISGGDFKKIPHEIVLLHNLEFLHIDNNKLTDETIDDIIKSTNELKNLRTISLKNNSFSEEGIKKLHQLESVRIVLD